ncbi:MAG TPA: hypothetical protein VHN99_07890 [Deinococcales bacterium]|nr:hypothetical protein [Deinococcales bacterium]
MTKLSLINHAYGEVQCQFAPGSVTRETQGGWTSQVIAGSDDPLRVWQGGGGQNLSFTLEFVGPKGREHLKALEATARRGAWRNAHQPPIWLLYIGKKVTPVIVESVRVTEDTYDRSMQAGHATADVSLARYKPFTVGAT